MSIAGKHAYCRLRASRLTDVHACIGSLYRLRDGRTVPLSLPGSMDPTFDLSLHSSSTAFPQARQSNLTVSGSSSTGCLSNFGSSAIESPSNGKVAPLSLSSRQSNTLLVAENVHHCCPVCPSPRAALRADSSPAASQSGAGMCQQRAAVSTSGARCAVDNSADAHFMAMAAKLIYEDPRVIADCLEHRCSCLQTSPWPQVLCSNAGAAAYVLYADDLVAGFLRVYQTIREADPASRWSMQIHDMQHILGHAERKFWLPDVVW